MQEPVEQNCVPKPIYLSQQTVIITLDVFDDIRTE